MLILHVAALAAIALLLPLARVLALRARARGSVRAHAAGERAATGSAKDDVGLVVLRGTLVVGGGIAQATRSDSPGATTTWACKTRVSLRDAEVEGSERAPDLALRSGAYLHELRGPVEVRAGSRFVFTGERIATLTRVAHGARTEVHDGDVVAVMGREIDSEEGQDYRSPRPSRVEAPAGAPIRLVALAEPNVHVRGTAVFRDVSALALTLVGLLPLVSFAWDYWTADCTVPCQGLGLCRVGSRFAGAALADALDRVVALDHVECIAGSDEDCRRSEVCKAYGWCTVGAGLCGATQDEDCRRARPCGELGWCSAVDGQCRAATNDDCARTRACLDLGRCTAQHGECVANSKQAR